MKKYAHAAMSGILATAGVAHCQAQSTVTLYGIVDEGITYSNSQNGHAAWQEQSSVASGSRWGLRGNEDLGGQNHAVFVLENAFDPSTGMLRLNGRMFGRQAYVGLSNERYGMVTLGRQYDELVDMLSSVSASLKWSLYFEHAGDIDNLGGSVRVNNAVKYTSPTIDGFKFAGLYSFGGQPGALSAQSTSSAGLSYSHGPLYVAAAYFEMKNPFAAGFDSLAPKNIIYSAYVPSASSWRVMGAGTSYAIGPVTTGFVYTSTRFANGFDGADVHFDNYEANVGWLVQPELQLGTAFVYTHGKLDANDTAPNYREVDLQADYILSKRTDAYVTGVYLKAAGAATRAQITAIPAPSSTPTQIAARIGIRHRF